MSETIAPPGSWRHPYEHWRTLIRHPWYRHLVAVQDTVLHAIDTFFRDAALTALMMPTTTASISSPMGIGSDSLPVRVRLHGVDTYLADSMQFMLELGCRIHPEGTYYVMPCFRGERTDESHLAQFYHAEAEIAGTLADVMRLASRLVHSVAEAAVRECPESVVALAGGLDHVHALLRLSGAYPALRHDAAVALLRDRDPLCLRRDGGLPEVVTRAGEQQLVELAGREGVLWLTHFPHRSVPFYQAYDSDRAAALNADLLLGGRETVGAGQRHDTCAAVESALAEHGVERQAYRWYGELREAAPMRTSGFGLGIERLLMWLLRCADIRHLTLLFRENGHETIP